MYMGVYVYLYLWLVYLSGIVGVGIANDIYFQKNTFYSYILLYLEIYVWKQSQDNTVQRLFLVNLSFKNAIGLHHFCYAKVKLSVIYM